MGKKTVLVAGCGHGGLSAAYILAKNGYEVKVFEKKNYDELGYDWHDVIYKPDFDSLEIDLTAGEGELLPFYDAAYTNPKQSVKLVVEQNGSSTLYCADRRFLLKRLADTAANAGAEINYGVSVTGAVVKNSEVKGISTDKGDFYGDLIIDSAGIDSPVRASLPASWGIMNEIPESATFYTYRAYFENLTGEVSSPPQTIYFYHCGKKGMDWSVTDEKFIDVLVGRFYPFGEDDAIEAIEDVRKSIPFMGEKIVRGGSFEKIPLRLSLPLFVWNGYAAVGDSACMTDPLSGSGINNSVKAGAMLAETVMGARSGRLTLETLWKYQYDYLTKHAKNKYSPEITRKMLTALSADDIDYFFEKKILTERELGSGGKADYTASETIGRALAFIPKLNLLPAMAGVPYKNNIAAKSKKLLPEKYSYDAYMKWRKEYEKI